MTRTTFPTRKAATLLAYLVTHPGNHSREKLLEIFWPELELDPARHALSMALSHLRNALERDFTQPKGTLLRASRDSIGLETAAYSTDMGSLPAGFDTERLLPGFYDDWVLKLRQHIAETVPPASSTTPLSLEPLPAALVPFLGRHELRGSLPGLLASTRLLTLVGTGGVGKTRLALELLRDFEAEGKSVAWVELAALTDPETILDRAAINLGLKNDEALVHALRQSPLLLGLDNCEHLIEGAAQGVRRLLRACPLLTVLATSREPLQVTGETLVRVPCLTEAESIELFCGRAVQAQPGWELTPQERPLLAQICQRLDGLPLALELAATQLRRQTLPELAQHLEGSTIALPSGNRGGAPRQQTVQAAIAWSYQLLSEPEKELFVRLAIFHGGWTLEAASALGTERLDTQNLLDELVDKSLIQLDRSERGRRYYFLETIREFAQARLAELPPETALALRRKHLEFYYALAESGPGMLSNTNHLWVLQLDPEQDNVRQALSFCRTDQPERAVSFCNILTPYWATRASFREQKQQCQETLAQFKAPPMTPAFVRFLNDLCANLQVQANWEEASAVLALLPPDVQDLLTLSSRAMLAFNQGQLEKSHELFMQSFQEAQRHGTPEQQASALTNRASVLIAQRKLAEARDALTQARALTTVPAYQTSGFALVDLLEGKLASARAVLQEKLADDLARNYHYEHAYTITLFALLAVHEGSFQQAAQLFGASMSWETYQGQHIQEPERSLRASKMAFLKTTLGEIEFATAFSQGEYLHPEQTLALLTAPCGTV